MAPLSQEISPVSSVTPQHIGPAIAEVNSVWFKFWIYEKLGCGPSSILFTKGTRLRRLPRVFMVTNCDGRVNINSLGLFFY